MRRTRRRDYKEGRFLVERPRKLFADVTVGQSVIAIAKCGGVNYLLVNSENFINVFRDSKRMLSRPKLITRLNGEAAQRLVPIFVRVLKERHFGIRRVFVLTP